VNVLRPGGLGERTVEVAMLDVVAAPAKEVTGAARRAAGWPHALRHLGQIHFRIRHAGPGGRLLVTARRVVADQTVDVLGLLEVEVLVLPTVAGVTTGATRLIGRQRNAVVVDGGLLAQLDRLAAVFLLSLPGPVDRMHEVLGLLLMAGQALLSGFGPGLDRSLDELRVVWAGIGQSRQRKSCQGSPAHSAMNDAEHDSPCG